MCLLIALYKVVLDYPIIIAANRDESYDRQSLPPRKINDSPSILAGKDRKAGGTWLGVNEFGLVVGVTNRGHETNDPTARSRGLLCLDSLGKSDVLGVRTLFETESALRSYNPFNLFYADSDSCWVSYFDGESAISEELSRGIHVLTNYRVDDRSVWRVSRAFTLLEQLSKKIDIEDVINFLMRICRDHGEGESSKKTLCVHGDSFGTLSSTIIALSVNFPHQSFYLHTEGRPCEHDYKDFSSLFSSFAPQSEKSR